jgi:BirA family biotin operon repressor/biotin-[acetyl-CoA-carboxylase] ligase
VAALSANQFHLDRLRRHVRPFRLHWFSRLRSTNDHAALLRKRGQLFAPAIVLTSKQIAGRGRNSNTWWSGDGSLTVTFVLPIDEQLSPHQLPLIAGLAVRDAMAEISGEKEIQLKWPNDLLFHGKKLAGLLCERVHKADLIGVGINVNAEKTAPKGLRPRMTFLSEIARRQFDKNDVLIAIVKHLYPMVARRSEHPFAAILRRYDRHHALVGKRVKILQNANEGVISGVCGGLDSMGRLLLTHRGEMRRIIAGQVEML